MRMLKIVAKYIMLMIGISFINDLQAMDKYQIKIEALNQEIHGLKKEIVALKQHNNYAGSSQNPYVALGIMSKDQFDQYVGAKFAEIDALNKAGRFIAAQAISNQIKDIVAALPSNSRPPDSGNCVTGN